MAADRDARRAVRARHGRRPGLDARASRTRARRSSCSASRTSRASASRSLLVQGARHGHRGLGDRERRRAGRLGRHVRLPAGPPRRAARAEPRAHPRAAARRARPRAAHALVLRRVHGGRRRRGAHGRRAARRAPDRLPALDPDRARARRHRDRGADADRQPARRRRDRCRVGARPAPAGLRRVLRQRRGGRASSCCTG